MLSLVPKPDTAAQWRVRQQIIAEMHNEIDTFGVIETGMDEEESVHSNEGQETTDDDWNF